jgi:hypothetical protein
MNRFTLQGLIEKNHRLRFCNQEQNVIEIGGAFKVELVARMAVDTPDCATEFPLSNANLPPAAGTRYAHISV